MFMIRVALLLIETSMLNTMHASILPKVVSLTYSWRHWPFGAFILTKENCSTVEPGFRNQSRSPWLRFLNPGSALNQGRSISLNQIWLPVLSALNQGSALNPRFLNPGSTVFPFHSCCATLTITHRRYDNF